MTLILTNKIRTTLVFKFSITLVLQEYPYHLIATKDERLIPFLTDWEVFDILYNEVYSTKLLYLWRTGSDFETMEYAYMTKLTNYANGDKVDKEILCLRYTRLARFL